jgi:hypothetical protein
MTPGRVYQFYLTPPAYTEPWQIFSHSKDKGKIKFLAFDENIAFPITQSLNSK